MQKKTRLSSWRIKDGGPVLIPGPSLSVEARTGWRRAGAVGAGPARRGRGGFADEL